MKFKIGDKVRVVKTEETNYWYRKFIGQVFTLKKLVYDIKERRIWSVEGQENGRLVESDLAPISKLDKVLE